MATVPREGATLSEVLEDHEACHPTPQVADLPREMYKEFVS